MASDIGRRALVIEDDRGVVRMLPFSLSTERFDTTEVIAGSEALHSLQRDPPDAAILDLRLANGQGRAVPDWLHQCAQRTRSRRIWIVNPALDRQETTKRQGPLGNGFPAKPFEP